MAIETTTLIEIGKMFVPIVGATVGAYFASRWTLSKAKKERFWDERRSSYRTVINAFEELGFFCDQSRAEHCCEPTLNIETKVDESLRTISKYSVTGFLVFSTKFYDVLVEANKEILQAIYKTDEEKKPDRGDERAESEWRFVLANELGSVITKFTPQLVEIAKSEEPIKI